MSFPEDIYSQRILELAAAMPRTARLAAPHATATAHSKLCGSTVSVDLAMRLGPQCGITHRPAAERIDLSRQVAITANGVREVDRADDELWRRPSGAGRRGRRKVRRHCCPNLRRRRDALEKRARRFVNRCRIVAETVVKLEGGGGVDALKVLPTQ